MSDDWTTVSPQAEKEEEKVEFEIENEAGSYLIKKGGRS